MTIIYKGTAAEVEAQQKCDHIWEGPFNARGTSLTEKYYQCGRCTCTKNVQYPFLHAQPELGKKELLHKICGGYVNALGLNYDFHCGGGVVTLHISKYGPGGHTRPEPEHTELSFPFEKLTIQATKE